MAPDVSPELIAICEKAMSREPPERYPNMAELGHDLRAYLEHRVVRAYRIGPVVELRKWVQRNRALATTAAAALVVVVALSGTWTTILAGKNTELRAIVGERDGAIVLLEDANELLGTN